MRYFIAHLLSGDAKRCHERVVRELRRTHKIPLPKRHSPPHLTIKPPFECGLMGIVEVERALRAFARAHTAPRCTLKGFGRFGFKTVYLDLYRSPEAVAFVRACVAHLNREVRWLPRNHLEGNTPHVSVARHLDRATSVRVWRAIKHLNATADMYLDTLVVLKRTGDQWVTRTIIHVPRTALLPLPHD